MSLDPRLPVVVGAGQLTRRPGSSEVSTAPEPMDMMVEVLRRAAGSHETLLTKADSIRVPELVSWRYPNAGALIAERVGASPRQTVYSTTGGNTPQAFLNDAAAAIQRGELDTVLIAGAEAVYTRFLVRKTKDWLQWTQQPADVEPPELYGDPRPGTNDIEMARSIVMPTQVYPIFENALRAAAGESIDEHQRKVSELWSSFSAVAAENPHAWSPEFLTPEEIRTVTPDNRMIGFPYPKYMNSNIQTDQAAAVIVCSVAAAQAAGVPEDEWVFVHGGADANDHYWISERDDLASSPALRACGQAIGIHADEVAHADLYSCFPSAVQVAAKELGFGLDRRLTVTGGLCFAGGPANNYVTHAIAAMYDVLRGDPGSLGVVTALGWYLTKHSVGLYSTTPPAAGFRHEKPSAPGPRRDYTGDYEGPVTVEAYTVMHERDGSPVLGIVACLLPDGRRAWGNVYETGLLKAMTQEEFCGRAASLVTDGLVVL